MPKDLRTKVSHFFGGIFITIYKGLWSLLPEKGKKWMEKKTDTFIDEHKKGE